MSTGASSNRQARISIAELLKLSGSREAHGSLISACCARLKLAGWPHSRINQKPTQKSDGSWHSPGADRGAADIFACVPVTGVALYIECKTGTAEPSADQRVSMRVWAHAGAHVLLVRAVSDLDRFIGLH